MNNFINIIQILYTIGSILITVYLFIRSKILSQITSYIKDAAEYNDLTGPEKMDMVVSWVKDLIPRITKVIFTDKVIREMAENVYQDMKSYSKNYVKERTGLSINSIEKIVKNIDKE